jgi:hypothetical protein
MSELGDKRKLFTRLLPRLIDKMVENGYEPMHGKDGLKHMKNSLHYEGLAVDIDLTKDGVYLADTKDHEPFGVFWESLGGSWGGRFKDGNHYSVEYQGRK